MNLYSKITLILVSVCAFLFPADANAQEPFKRGIEQHKFIPKGQIVAGFNASFSQSNQSNYQFLIIEGVSGNTYSMKVSPMVCYIFKDNLGLGGRFVYSRSRTKLDNAKIVIDSETDYDIENLYNINQRFSTMAIFRNYISLGNSKRFGLCAEVQLEFGTGTSKITNGKGDDFTGTYIRDYSVDLGLAPGLIMFLNNYSAIELNVGVLGFGYSHKKMTTDQVHVSNLKTKSANFRINLFSISIGVAFYL